MTKDYVRDWDTTASNNTDIAGINIDENCAAANINNAIRAMMKQMADLYAIQSAKYPMFATYGGTANAVTLTTGLSLTALTAGQAFAFRATASNTLATTINVDGIGTVAAKTITGADLPSGYIRTGIDTVARYDGTDIIVEREIERGTGANGRYVKYADGTLECNIRQLELTYVAGTRCGATWTFPSAFVDTTDITATATFIPPTVTDSPETYTDSATPGFATPTAIVLGNLSASSVVFHAFRVTGGTDFQSGDTMYISASARGNWY